MVFPWLGETITAWQVMGVLKISMEKLLISGAALSVLLACAPEDMKEPISTKALVDSLSEQGPYGVGYRSYSVTYETPISKMPRTVQALVWYPSNISEGDRPLYLVKSSEIAVQESEPAALKNLPVIVYSHGHQAYPAVMSYLMEHWASHGYIVISPGHTGNTVINGSERETDIFYLRAHDLRASIDFLRDLKTDPLTGMFSNDLIVSGHSFGGYTAFGYAGAMLAIDRLKSKCDMDPDGDDFCSTLTPEKEALFRAGLKDERVRAVMSFDAGNFDLYGAEGIANVDVPVLHAVAELGNHADPDPQVDKFWTALHHKDDIRLLLAEGAHNDFVDSCGAGVKIRCSDLEPELVWRAMRIYTLAFIKRSFDGASEPASILNGTEKVWANIQISTRASP